MSNTLTTRATEWLRQGTTPTRLAITLALGLVIGCLPIFGVTTGLCLVIALIFRLNIAAIQAANYAALPAQLLLLLPYLRLGEWLFHSHNTSDLAQAATALHHLTPSLLLTASHGLTMLLIHAATAWLLTAIPATSILTLALKKILRAIPIPQ